MKIFLIAILVSATSTFVFADEQSRVDQISKVVQARANCVGVTTKIDFWKNDLLIQTNLLDSSYKCSSASSDLELYMGRILGIFSALPSEYARPSIYGVK